MENEVLLNVFLATRGLSQKTKSSFSNVLEHARVLALPSGLDLEFEKMMKAVKTGVGPSDALLHESQLTLDTAMVLHQRYHNTYDDCAMYLWWDATPKGIDWLLSQVHIVASKDQQAYWKARQALHHRLDMCKLDEGDIAATKAMNECVTMHTFLPVGLGLRMGKLEHKLSAWFHALACECVDWSQLVAVCRNIVSVTTDLGTESGMVSWHTTDLEPLLPEWIVPPRMDSMLGSEEEPEGPGQPRLGTQFLLPNAFPVAGMWHIVSNCLKDVHHHLAEWKSVLPHFKALEKLLHYRPRRERFANMCIVDLETRALFENSVPLMYEERWSGVLIFLKALHPLLPALVANWNPVHYTRGHSDGIRGSDTVADDDFNTAEVSRALSSKFFVAYTTMLLALDSVTESLAFWSEGCSCHDDALSAISSRRKSRHFRG